jgi:hypothetical protein
MRISADWINHTTNSLPDVIPIKGSGIHFVLSNRCREFIDSHSQSRDQWISVAFNDERMWLYRPLNIIDVINEEQSDIETLPTGRILRINTYVFKNDVSLPETMFLAATNPYHLLCGSQFRESVTEQGWTGFYFSPVWDDKLDPFPVGPTRKQVEARPEIFGPGGIVSGYEDAWPDEWKIEKPNH